MDKDELGRYGEELAARHLQRAGWTLLDRNWRCDVGEIDIVARRADVLTICEVKTRRSTRCGTPLEAVTPKKAARLRTLAARWLAAHDTRSAAIRIDVIAISIDARGTNLLHLEGVC